MERDSSASKTRFFTSSLRDGILDRDSNQAKYCTWGGSEIPPDKVVVGDVDAPERAQLVEGSSVQRPGGLGTASQRPAVILVHQGHATHKGEERGELPAPSGI
jgi:hypothetical protein